MPMRRPFALAFAFLGMTAGVFAQTRSPRFTLPETPYSYASGSEEPIDDGKSFLRSNTPGGNPLTDAGASLGRVLFYDRQLSRNRSVACGSCHVQARAFADGRARSRGDGGRPGARNSMPLMNLRFRIGTFFWDGRRDTLEAAVLDPIQNPIEMGMDLQELVLRLESDPDYAPLFGGAFGDPAVTPERIGRALAQFVRSMTSLGSRFDAGLAKESDVTKDFENFTAEENRGKRIFFGDGERSCASCHMQIRQVGWCGNAIERSSRIFQGNEPMNNGVDPGRESDDAGQGAVTGKPEDRGKFRAPSLRNVALTAPYMHDGRFETLEDVVRFYALRVRRSPTLDRRMRGGASSGASHGWGGSASLGLNGAGSALGFALNSKERRDLLAFLLTLTDEGFVTDPRFADPFR